MKNNNTHTGPTTEGGYWASLHQTGHSSDKNSRQPLVNGQGKVIRLFVIVMLSAGEKRLSGRANALRVYETTITQPVLILASKIP
jgi:hypothetical protein